MTERMLGIVGGVGPESTADYYRRLIDRWRERGPADTYPSILLNSLNIGRRSSLPVLDATGIHVGAAIDWLLGS